MRRTLIRKTILCLAGVLFLLSGTSCKTGPSYSIGEYLDDLAFLSGIGISEDRNENLRSLAAWGIIENRNIDMDQDLNYGFLSETICRLLDEDGEALEILKEKG